MKAYCYRTGHILIGTSVPQGAIELADHQDEAELLMVIRWHTKVIEEASGVPAMVIPGIVEAHNETMAVIRAVEARKRIQEGLVTVRVHPHARSIFTAKPPEAWSQKSCDLARRYA